MRWNIKNGIGRLVVCMVTVFAVTALIYLLPVTDRTLTAVLTFLFVVLTVSALWGFRYAIFASLLSAFAVSWLAPPVGYFEITDTRDWFALGAFLVIGLVGSNLSDRARRQARAATVEITKRMEAEKVLRERADLLDLTHDTVFVRDMNDVITYWNRGAGELYGWTEEEAVGQITHTLLKTMFPAPLEQINAELLRTGRWEGELTHTKRDGTQVVVASRWSLQRDEQGKPAAILETNNDISERKQAEEALRTAETRFRSYVDHATDALFVHDEQWKIVDVNQQACESLGYSREELIGMTPFDFNPSLDKSLAGEFGKQLDGGEIITAETSHRRKDGTLFPVEVRVRRLRHDGQLFSLAVARDITDRKRTEEALRERARLLDLTHDTIFVRDMNDVITYWNRGAQELYGWTEKEAVGQVSHRLTQTIFPALLEQINAELLGTGRWEGELTHTKRDGTQVVVASRWSLQRDEVGKPAAILETNNDITERKQAEAKLRESEDQWRDVFENNPTMYFMVDASGTVLSVNPFGAEQLGYTVDELIGQPVLSVFPEPEREAVQTKVASCLAQIGSAKSWEARKVRRDGTEIWVRETAKAVPRAHGPIVLIACEDITEQRRAAEALRQAQTDLTRVSRVTTMGELTASLAHEVNQPITAAVTNARTCVRWLAGDSPNIEEARNAATLSAKDAARASEIISRIRLLFQKGTLQRELIDLNEVIGEMVLLLRAEASRYSVSLRTHLAAGLPQLMADRVQLQQVIMNLIMNGIEATKDVDQPREIVIRSERAEDEELLVSVSDTGVGLPAEQADQIFNAFFTTKLQGTGMGLSISRSIIESHGGHLWAASNSPRGATFCFTLSTKPEGPA